MDWRDEDLEDKDEAVHTTLAMGGTGRTEGRQGPQAGERGCQRGTTCAEDNPISDFSPVRSSLG